mmetsp:Transcript_19082/g.41785  ORF Transcript_19082/g.41785 Transcript_19082/m.41785 type:complete len:235 (-) Transcript_19082:330-1034(-)|eukprot:CAMPEP_0118922352 /NCGR_PEP_ID=MMETSP1169-20130426/1305_1 /TAXON_ID=36882 /ORGANISM="Pyramimonas obovata, Strain CCMP722" /LENGTH=234 /DNA_ID=CAMNT_0006863199 /DNA_START=167 /DNA_END=871 /DNA_ORIENTATION=-
MWRRAVSRVKQYVKDVSDHRAPEETALFSFKSQADCERWEVFTDSQMGGRSVAQLRFDHGAGTALFSGELSGEKEGVKPGQRVLRKTGFCGFRSLPPDSWAAGPYLDLEPYNVLGFKIKGDGRPYLASIRTENWAAPPGAPPDLWQAFVFAPPGEWKQVEVPFKRFVLTWRGRVIEQPYEMSTNRVVSLGISLAMGDKLQDPGRFALDLESIFAARRDYVAEDGDDRGPMGLTL